MKRQIIEYYDRLAPTYDEQRFANSFGRFYDQQEKALIRAMLPLDARRIMDLACGTGRLAEFASHGCDGSAVSIAIARSRYPDKAFAVCDAAALPFDTASFDAVICFHLLMHMDADEVDRVFFEAARILRPSGVFICDIVSAKRRALSRRPASGWHGDTSLNCRELNALGAQHGLRMTSCAGVAFLPVHRLPRFARRPMAGIDSIIARLFPDFASYLVGRFQRDPRK